jgi:hypothetical protein
MVEFSIRPFAAMPATLLLLVAASAIGLAACGGSSSPHVANLGTSSGQGSRPTATLPTGTATQLLDEWGACMRSHGDPGQVDPTVDANKVIQITLPQGYAEGLRGGSGRLCASYLTAAQTALRGGEPPETTDLATAVKFAECMRSNGVPDFPDPTGDGQTFHANPGSNLDPANPAFQAASTLCANKTGFAKFGGGSPQPGQINLNIAGGPGGKPSGNSGSGANPGAGVANG